MKRVMMSLVAMAVLSLMAGPLLAGEAEQTNAQEFVDTLKDVNDGVLGEQSLDIRMLGHTVGKMKVAVSKGDYNGAACYVMKTEGTFDMGVARRMEGTAHIAPNLSLLHGESKDFTGDKLEKHTLFEVGETTITATVKRPEAEDEADREKIVELEKQARNLIGGAEMLVYLLLPQVPKNYEFNSWDEEDNTITTLTIQAKGPDKKFEKEAYRFHSIEVYEAEDETGATIEHTDETDCWVAGARILHLESGEGFVLSTGAEAKHTPITREEAAKQDDPVATAAGFFMAQAEKDEDFMDALVNQVRFARIAMDNNPQTKDLSDEEKDFYAQMYAGKVIEQMLAGSGDEAEKTEEDIATEKFMSKLILNRENFKVVEDGDSRRVQATEQAAKLIGKLEFILEKNAETEKWEITWIGQAGDQEEASEEDEEDSEEGDDDDF